MVAGEASGDQLGEHLIRALRQYHPNLEVVGIGGPKMHGAGMAVWYPMEKLAVRGYAEVLRHYREIVGIRKKLCRRLLADPPDVFVGIDAPDFNLDLEIQLKAGRIPTVHYVSPSIWAWRGKRIEKIRRAVDHVLALFPFEPRLYEAAGVPVTYVGHPLADRFPMLPDQAGMREQMKIAPQRTVLAFLPGSRQSELVAMSDLFVRTAQRLLSELQQPLFLVPLITRTTREIFEAAIYRHQAQELPWQLMFGHAHDAMIAADLVLVASGTATLEAALLKRPMVITYRMNEWSWQLMRRQKYQPYVGLPNILSEEFVVPEFLQHEATPENLAQAALNWLRDPTAREKLQRRFVMMHQSLQRDTAALAAGAVLAVARGPSERSTPSA